MQRPELLEATASEPLTFEQELEMQRELPSPFSGFSGQGLELTLTAGLPGVPCLCGP